MNLTAVADAARPILAPSRRWTGAIGAALALRLTARARRLSNSRWWGRHTLRIQRETLRRLIGHAAGTEFGRRHSFGTLAGRPDEQLIAAYRAAVPIADYEAFRPLMQRMRESAEKNVTWPGLVLDWAETSGTTGGEKFIPVSRQMMKSNYRAALDIFAHAARFGASISNLTSGRLLFLGGSTDVTVSRAGIRTGDLSGLVTPLIRWPLSEVYSPGPDIARMTHWPSKIDAMARLTLEQDIRMVSGMASWALVLFQRVVEIAREQRPWVNSLRDVWPNLELFVHGGVKYAPFDPRVREIWSGHPSEDIPRRLEVYPASEGFIAVQDTPGDPALRLHTDIGNFYEFVPLEEIDRPDARAFTTAGVERGQRYVVVMTTCAGLWRYIIGDVVEFDTIPPDGPPRLRIVGRHRHFINAFGENLIVEDIERAVIAARDATGLRTGEFTAAPVYPAANQRAGLQLAIEFDTPPPPAAIEHFRDAFDRSLRATNVDYGVKRTGDLGMAPPKISPVPMGAFHRWMESKGKLGGQHKAPRCANHREIIDGLLATAGEC
ncbi:MAG: GH3 auxin-responsive promoter family protein [Phycisphaerae bacterium]|nr:GH3 auxin-responsive promoter family protein [Phycisphaerae bacterium]